MTLPTLYGALADLASGAATSATLTAAALQAIEDPNGEGSRAFIRRFDAQARACAAGWDAMRAAGVPLPPLAGIPLAVKDLTDVAGSTTTAGSTALADAAPASRDAAYLTRLRNAGAVIVGTTNMTEFAMGGLGLNPHFGTPRNPYDRAVGRIPGGSSSGAAVAVTDGMAVAAIGSDTAGSVRMPAALCGVAGFKPTARRIPLEGTVPLAASLDSIGPLAQNVADCALLDAVLANDVLPELAQLPLRGFRFAIPQTLVLDDLDSHVAATFERACKSLADSGAIIVDAPFALFGEFPAFNAHGGYAVAEGYAWHRALLERRRDHYDPIIAARFANGAHVTAADYIELNEKRADLIRRANRATAPYDALLMPTVPIVAPPIVDFDGDEARWLATNRLLIRNPGIGNVLDRCALSLPIHDPGTAPVGLMLMGETLGDARLLTIGAAVEAALALVLR